MNGMVRVTLAVKRSAMLLVAAGLFFSFSDVIGQSPAAASSPSVKDDAKQAATSNHASGVKMLTDTQVMDFGPYIRKSLAITKKNCFFLIPEGAPPPSNVSPETVIPF